MRRPDVVIGRDYGSRATCAWCGTCAGVSAGSDDPRRNTSYNGPGRYILGDDRARGDDRVVTDGHSLEDDGPAADPYAVADVDRQPHRSIAAHSMLVRVHDHDIPRDHAVAPNDHFLLSDDLHVAVEVGAVAD